MKLPQEQLVLVILGNCADPDGVAFAKWPGRDHWWKYLAELTRLSRSSLFRHINTIVALGLGRRDMLVLADGSRRPTIALDLTASFNIKTEEDRYEAAVRSRQSHGETDTEKAVEDDENDSSDSVLDDENALAPFQSHGETGSAASPTSGNDPVPPVGLHIDSIEDSNNSPLPPSGGARVPDPLWDEFVRSWGDAIQRMALAKAAWDRTASDKRPMLIAAAKGFRAYMRANPKAPSSQSAQSFIRDELGWEQWLRYTPSSEGAAVSIVGSYPLASREGTAICRLFEIAGCSAFLRSVMIRNGQVSYSRPLTPQILALAADDYPKPDKWTKLTKGGAGSWNAFFRDAIAVQTRRPLTEGSLAPWPFAPSSTGKIYSTGPPDTLMTEQDITDFT